ncbi:peptidase M23, partial [Pseudomonas fluorescens]
EAKKTTLSLELESPAEQLTQDQDATEAVEATNEAAPSPFAQIENTAEEPKETAEAAPAPAPAVAVVAEEKKQDSHRKMTVA